MWFTCNFSCMFNLKRKIKSHMFTIFILNWTSICYQKTSNSIEFVLILRRGEEIEWISPNTTTSVQPHGTYGNVCFLRLHGFFSKNMFLEDQTTTSFIWIMKIAKVYNVPSTHFSKEAHIIWIMRLFCFREFYLCLVNKPLSEALTWLVILDLSGKVLKLLWAKTGATIIWVLLHTS